MAADTAKVTNYNRLIMTNRNHGLSIDPKIDDLG